MPEIPADSFECRVSTGEDNVALMGLAFGIGVISAGAASVLFGILVLVIEKAVRLPDSLTTFVVMAASAYAGWRIAREFVRWRRKVAAERRLVIDGSGITYWAYADRHDLTRWEEIERVVQTVAPDPDTSYTFMVHRRGRRNLKLDGEEFPDYEGIKEAIQRRIGGRLVL